jgi:hypothetical protein
MRKPSVHDAAPSVQVIHPFVMVLQDADRNDYAVMFDSQESMDDVARLLAEFIREGKILNIRAVHSAAVSRLVAH